MYSHPATKTDQWVLSKVLGNTFVELGAYDGIYHNNTLLLENNGWRGLLIEALPGYAQRIKRQRPLAEIIVATIGRNNDNTQEFIIGGEYSGLVKSMPQKWVEEHVRRCSRKIGVRPQPLYNFVHNCDYLSLDTEGNEFEIITDWLKAGGRCQALTIEFHYDRFLLDNLVEMLEHYNLKLDEIRGFDACFLAS